MSAAGSHHAAAMALIHASAFPDAPWSEASFSQLLAQPGVAGFIDPRGGLLLLRCAADEAEILTLGVARLRQGIATALMREAIAHAKSRNAATMYLEVAQSNLAAGALYRSLGFAQTGRRRNYYENGEEALILSLDLGDR